jgi:Rieske Fe-S protein
LLHAVAALVPFALVLRADARAENKGTTDRDPARKRPQRGDRLTPLEGPRRGETLRVDDLEVGGPPLLVVPLDLETGTVRDGSRLNQVRLLRLAEGALGEETKRYAAAGTVAYSGVCSHTGCPVSEWNPETKRLVCPCHGSEFDPAARATVKNGPAPRRLAILPLREEDGVIIVRGGFRGKVGFSLG